jgi:hypothetical protein
VISSRGLCYPTITPKRENMHTLLTTPCLSLHSYIHYNWREKIEIESYILRERLRYELKAFKPMHWLCHKRSQLLISFCLSLVSECVWNWCDVWSLSLLYNMRICLISYIKIIIIIIIIILISFELSQLFNSAFF